MSKPLLVVVSAPSGAGKSTLCDRLLEEFDYIVYSISCTTRDPRGEEEDGIVNKSKVVIQEKGGIATFIQETHCLAFTDFLIKEDFLKKYNSYEIAALLSCFANIRVKEDKKIHDVSYLTTNTGLNKTLQSLSTTTGAWIWLFMIDLTPA